jgi:NAD(P)H dehydrogenase (quinone)
MIRSQLPAAGGCGGKATYATSASSIASRFNCMRILVIYAHPRDDSYAAALRDTVIDALEADSHTVDLCDLYKEAFDPVLTAHECRVYMDTSRNIEAISEHVQRLRNAEGIILIFPSWWYGMPAILKGYFDRVWLPGVAFDVGTFAIKPLLARVRLFGVVTTTGASAWFTRLFIGNPSRKVLMRGIARLVATPTAERFWLALHGIDKGSAKERARFIVRVQSRIHRIRPNKT